MEPPPIRITLGPQPLAEISPADSGTWGAEISFIGRVRDTEDGRPLRGITYTAYPAMAQRQMEQLATELQSEYGPHPLTLHHRLGFIPNGHASLWIIIAGKHSAATFALLAEYVRRLKIHVPIWKQVEYL